MKTYVHTKPCTGIFVTALFIIAPIWKQPKYLSKDEQLHCDTSLPRTLLRDKKEKKKKKVNATTSMELKGIMQGEKDNLKKSHTA